jgi:hypothetical protein
MIIFLTGPTGSGKTDTSWALVSALDDIVFLDCDWFASRSPFSWKDSTAVVSVYRAMRSQIHFHLGEGRKQFVVTLTLEMAALFQTHYSSFADFDRPMHAFRFSSRPDVVKRRIISRDRIQKDEEAANAILQQVEFDRLFPDETIFLCIDTSDLASDEVAKLIVQRVNG